MQNNVLITVLLFCERFCTSSCISPTNLPEIVGFLKFVGEIQ